MKILTFLQLTKRIMSCALTLLAPQLCLAAPGVDIAFVIDNSSGVYPFQQRISRNFSSVIGPLMDIDWRIAVVTTSSACLRTPHESASRKLYITRDDYLLDPLATEIWFREMIQVGEGGDWVEKGILRATEVLTEQGCASENAWLRPETEHAVVLMTNEENCGSGSNEGCPGAPYASADYYFDRVRPTASFHGFFLLQEPPRPTMDPNDPLWDCENTGGYMDPPDPGEYLRLVQGTGGIYADVCLADYQKILESIATEIRSRVDIRVRIRDSIRSRERDISGSKEAAKKLVD